MRSDVCLPEPHYYASVAQGIERCPPEACAAVRFRSDAEKRRYHSGVAGKRRYYAGIRCNSEKGLHRFPVNTRNNERNSRSVFRLVVQNVSLNFFSNIQKNVRYNRIKVLSAAFFYDMKAFIQRQCIPVTALCRYRIKHIGNCHYPGTQWDFTASQSVRVTFPVPFFVMMSCNLVSYTLINIIRLSAKGTNAS